MLMPTADADRQIQVNLPDGVSLEPPVGRTQSARLDISVDPPLPWQDLSVSLEQVFVSHDSALAGWSGQFTSRPVPGEVGSRAPYPAAL